MRRKSFPGVPGPPLLLQAEAPTPQVGWKERAWESVLCGLISFLQLLTGLGYLRTGVGGGILQFRKAAAWGSHASSPAQQATDPRLSWLLGAGGSPPVPQMAHSSPGTFGRLWITNVREASRTPHQFMSTLLAPILSSEIL